MTLIYSKQAAMSTGWLAWEMGGREGENCLSRLAALLGTRHHEYSILFHTTYYVHYTLHHILAPLFIVASYKI